MPRKKKRRNTFYTDEEKRQAAIEYQVTGLYTKTAENLGIPYYTLQEWAKHDWWHELRESVRRETDDRIEAELAEVVALAHGRIKESLIDGDEKVAVNSKGEITRYKVKPTGKEAATIAGIAFDKRRLTLNMPTAIRSDSAKMTDLAEQFRQLADSFEEKKIGSIQGECEEVEDAKVLEQG